MKRVKQGKQEEDTGSFLEIGGKDKGVFGIQVWS